VIAKMKEGIQSIHGERKQGKPSGGGVNKWGGGGHDSSCSWGFRGTSKPGPARKREL